MPLLSVKLKPEDVRMAQALRKEGVTISDVVRDAIRAEYQRRIGQRSARKRASDRMAEIYAAYPDPPDLPARRYDVHDARAARQAVLTPLRPSAR
jgi:Arc/MetJ-type ribon-helix-helix transcriptional regulator